MFVAALGCDKATPVAPEGTTLTVSASPAQIGLNGSSVITIIGRKANGSPLNTGTEIRLSTDRGTIDPIVQVNSSGVATATLRADGRTGAAAVKAATADIEATTTVQIGQSAENKPSVILSVSPNNIPVGTGEATVTVIGRNSDGSSIGAGQQVLLTTTLGQFTNNRPVTRADGTATTTLRAGNVAGTATISAFIGSSDEKTTTVTIRDAATDISVDATPRTISEGGGTITISAFVTNSEGLSLQGTQVRFRSELGTFSSTTDFTDSQGLAEVTLTVTQDQIANFPDDNFEVTAETPSGGGDFISDEVVIRINRN
jgi:hypothetical protein